MKISTVVVLVLAVFANMFFWSRYNLPITPSDSRYPINGLSFNPFQRDHSPFDKVALKKEQLESDLAKIADKTRSIRLYTSVDGLEEVPQLARKYDLKITTSAWLDTRLENNIREVEGAIKLAGRNRNVTRVILGNETQLVQTVPREELIGYLDSARKRLRTPVSSAEPWDFWVRNPDFVNHVDFIAIHILPYWLGVSIDDAVNYTFEKYYAVKQRFPHKAIMIAETGWPSDGPQRGAAEATLTNQARFIREFVQRAEAEKVNYNIIEAFDQPWKSATEGRAGEHFGIMDAERNEKFSLAGAVLNDPNWEWWMLSSTFIGALTIGLLLVRRKTLKFRSKLFLAVMIQAVVTLAVKLAQEASGQYMSPGEITFWTCMITAQALLAVIFLTDTAEIADVVGERPLHRKFIPHSVKKTQSRAPMVSIHVACCQEPPEMVITTIESLARLDYPNFEVIVVDNNTNDPNLWRPVEVRCAELGPHFRFFTLGKWRGYKAGALNYALKVTNPQAEFIAVVDADYVVEQDWLSATIPYFKRAAVAVVQGPQEHRGWDGNLFQRMENDEYSGFFRIGMVQRNEDNAIIQHGTMTVIRNSAIEDVGGWAEWCICEDAELGLRLIIRGWEVIYIDHCFGRGLTPDSYLAYSKQRFRWAYGGMRIMRRYFPELIGLRGNLSSAQRYQFIKGWLPWIGDALHMVFTFGALFWSALLILEPLQTDFPEPIFIYPALALIALRIVGTAWTYAARVKIGFRRTLLAMCAGGSLTHKVAKAVFQGLFTSGKPFYRTPKMARAPRIIQSIVTAWEELVLGLVLCGAAGAILLVFGTINDDAVLWSAALVLQGLPYYAAVFTAIVSSISGRHSEDVKSDVQPSALPPPASPSPEQLSFTA